MTKRNKLREAYMKSTSNPIWMGQGVHEDYTRWLENMVLLDTRQVKRTDHQDLFNN
jgi:hypothetical protein